MHLALLHHLKGVGQICHRGQQAATGWPTLWPQVASNPPEINENQWKSMKTTSLDTPGPQYGHPWLPMAMRGIVFVTNRVPTTDLDEIPPPHWMVLRCASFWLLQNIAGTWIWCQNAIPMNQKPLTRLQKTLKSQNQANRHLRYAIRSQIAPRIQCRIPNQPKTNIRYKRICKKRGRRQRRSL